jgi:hypothetical protein
LNLPTDLQNQKLKSFYEATSCGKAAWNYLTESDHGQVFGVTSRGIFLQLDPKRIIFFSKEAYRGPLTVNFPDFEPDQLQAGDQATISRLSGVSFRNGPAFRFRESPRWEANPPDEKMDAEDTVRQRVKKCARLVLVEKRGAGMSSLLSELLNLNIPVETPASTPLLIASLSICQEEIRAGRYGGLVSILASLFGRGLGLTPSGDDVILGMLLAFTRHGELFGFSNGVTPNLQAFIQMAYARTTTLSANLIEAAAKGQADERLITGLDGLVNGKTSPEESAALLCDWGNSSGVDALVGFSLAVMNAPYLSRSMT